MMPQPAILPIFSHLNRSISDLNNFNSVPRLNHCELIRKSPKKFGLLVTKVRYSPFIDMGVIRFILHIPHLLRPIQIYTMKLMSHQQIYNETSTKIRFPLIQLGLWDVACLWISELNIYVVSFVFTTGCEILHYI